MPGGRPTKFNATVVRITKKYVQDHINQKVFPTVEELSVEFLNVDDDTVVEWTRPHEADDEKLAALRAQFSATIKRLKAYQKRHLIVQGLSGKVNTTMSIFLLKANHGFIETGRLEHSGPDGDPIPTSTITYMPKQLPDDYFSKSAADPSQ